MNLLITMFLVVSYGPRFLYYFSGSQPSGMGGAYVGIAEDAYAIFYNPSGLGFQKSADIGFSFYTIPLAYHNWNFSIALPLYRNSSIGLFGSGVSTKVAGESDTITDYEYATGLSFGHKLWEFLGAGINLKYIHLYHSTDAPELGLHVREKGFSFATDIGLLAKYQFLFGRAGLGFAIQHVGPEIRLTSGQKILLPITIRAGVSYTITAKEFFKDNSESWFRRWLKEKWRIVIAYDINKVIYRRTSHSFGVELRPVPFLALRLGYFLDPAFHRSNRREGLTKGIGFDFKFIRFDISDDLVLYRFGYLPPETNRYRFSLSLNMGEPIFPKNGLFGK